MFLGATYSVPEQGMVVKMVFGVNCITADTIPIANRVVKHKPGHSDDQFSFT